MGVIGIKGGGSRLRFDNRCYSLGLEEIEKIYFFLGV